MFNIIYIVIFIIFSAFFSSSETAIFSLSSTRLKRMQTKGAKAKRLKYLLDRPSYLLSIIVFGNMLVNIGLASLSTAMFVDYFGEKGIIFSIIFSGIIILFLGEIFPKTFAIYLAEPISIFSVSILGFLSRLFNPIIVLLQKSSDYISFFFLKQKKKSGFFTEEELKTALFLGKEQGVISEAEEEMITYLLKFKDTSASQIITPRVEVEAIGAQSSREEVLTILKKEIHSKFPVYKDSMDNIVGILYSRDVFLNPDKDWRLFLKEPILVPESRKIDDILTVFIKNNERIAVVLDEYGGTAGIVTFEDIVEEIFGEIYDEYEFPQKIIEKINEDTYKISGHAPVKTINLELSLSLPEKEDTIAGLLLAELERIPLSKERFNLFGYEFIIDTASRKRLLSIILKIK